MKIIQSLWTKPALSNQEYENSRMYGGWINYKYFIMSTCLSCLTARRYYKQIELYTDKYGYNLFINHLDLPYSYANQKLDELETEDSRLWVLGKLKTIEVQQEPFIHMDNDIYLWEKLQTSKSSNFLLAQNLLPVPLPYQKSLKEIQENFPFIPNCLNIQPSFNDTLANIGIIGGNNIGFFKEYCNTAFQLLSKNKDQLNLINLGIFNQILDEYLFICLAREKGLEVKYQIEDNFENDPMQAVLRFNLVPFLDKYIHLVGIAKKNSLACEQLELRLQYEFPQVYKQAMSFLNDINPELVIKSEVEDKRQKKLFKVFNKIYNNSLEELLNMPLKLQRDFKISVKSEKGKDPKTFLKKFGDDDNVLSSKELTGINELLIYFKSPVSINNLIEGLDRESSDYEYLKFRLIDVVTENIVTESILEFV